MRPELKLRQLTYFVAVAEELNFRRAAERLFISQPPLSRQIKMLEDALGARLFERDRQSVRLTDVGHDFLADARALLHESQQVMGRFTPKPAGAKLILTLGITTVIDVGRLAGIAGELEKICPGVRVMVKPQISAQSIRELRQGKIDVAVIGLPSRAEGLEIEHLGDDHLVACMASSHPLARKRRVSIRDLQSDQLFWFDRKLNPAYYDHCQQVFKRVGFDPRRLPEPADHHVLLGLIAVGQGIALVPRSLNSMARKGVVFKELVEGEQLGVRVAAAYDPSRSSHTVMSLVEMLKASWNTLIRRSNHADQNT